MKKLITVLALCLAGGALVFAQVGPKGTKEAAKEQEGSTDIQKIQLAHELANYGYENDSASALLQAAEILSEVNVRKSDSVAKKEGSQTAAAPEGERDYSPQTLVSDAKKLAGKDKNLLAWAKNVEKQAKSSPRGASRGPQYARDTAYGNGGTVTYEISFDTLSMSEVDVVSISNADFDVYVFDGNGDLLTYDESYNRNAYCSWFTILKGYFTIVVKNNSPYNATFELYTN